MLNESVLSTITVGRPDEFLPPSSCEGLDPSLPDSFSQDAFPPPCRVPDHERKLRPILARATAPEAVPLLAITSFFLGNLQAVLPLLSV